MGSGAFPNEGATAHTSGADASSRRSRRRDVAIGLLLATLAFLIYNANFRSISAADTYAARYLPFSIWRHHTLVLDPIVTAVAQGRKVPTSRGKIESAFWIVRGRGDHFVSLYPVAVPLIVAPLYLPLIPYLDRKNWDPLDLDNVARIMEKLCASLLAAGAVMLVYLLLRRRSEPGTAALLTLVFALGTTTWVVSSQALWMHGLGELSIAATLLLLTGPCTPWRAAAAGFVCALAACNRQPDAILAAGLGVYGLWWAGRRVPLFLAGGVLPVGFLLTYNLNVVGNVVGGYALSNWHGFVSGDILAGVAGLLFSPTHGLLVFSPFLVLAPFGLALMLRDRRTAGLAAAIGAAVVVQLVVYAAVDWRQGVSFGPRWLTDMLPMLFWMLPPVLVALPAAGRAAFGLACVVAVAIQLVGAFCYTGLSDAAVLAAEGPDKMRAAWDVRNAPFIAELKHPPAPADLTVDLRGNIDLVTVRDRAGDKPQRQVEVHGWTLTDNRAPADVAVMVDGQLRAGTSEFFARPDVMRAIGEPARSGWVVAFPADGLAPGEHVVDVLVRAYRGGDPRLLKESTFTLTADDEADRRDRDLADAARLAAKRLAEHQQSPGYWLTTFANAARFDHPRQEMNTFVNAVMIDVAAPVAEAAGLAGMLGRARDFLENQIEAGGLVRYHGRPDAPTIGRLGCAITPDADDTALVWRVAPGKDSELLPAALATLNRFRTADGLYRTWLAARDSYECIDPGKDANPADVVIQMHVLMLLAQTDPTAARALCAALQKRSGDADIWVYYANAPPMAILRLADLRKAGCPLELPQARLQSAVPGQDIWVEAAQFLQQMDGSEDRSATHPRVAELLSKLADGEFAPLKQTPPLLYHNDLTASVPRFYWSEDFGYALWLRLYFENERSRSRLRCPESNARHACAEK